VEAAMARKMRVTETAVESSASAVEWGAITAGALAAVGLSIVLMTFGPGIGLATVAAWYLTKSTVTLGVTAGIWLIVTQWLASGLGGYLAGRLRKKWVGIRTNEVFFRDTAHGFLAWALATLIIVALLIIAAIARSASGATQIVSPEIAEQATKAVAFSFYSSLALLIGAFIASMAGLLGGYHRDD
jgi:hypothetical protein